MADETEQDPRRYQAAMTDQQMEWFAEHVEELAKNFLQGCADAQTVMKDKHNAPDHVADDVIVNAVMVTFITVFCDRVMNTEPELHGTLVAEMVTSLMTRIGELTDGDVQVDTIFPIPGNETVN